MKPFPLLFEDDNCCSPPFDIDVCKGVGNDGGGVDILFVFDSSKDEDEVDSIFIVGSAFGNGDSICGEI